jgi:hypothetical protein
MEYLVLQTSNSISMMWLLYSMMMIFMCSRKSNPTWNELDMKFD